VAPLSSRAANAQALIDHSPSDDDTGTTCLLLSRLGVFLYGQGALAGATRLLARSVDSTQRVKGPDHPDTFISRNNLAHAYRAAGELGRAIPLFKSTLADREHSTWTTARRMGSMRTFQGSLDRFGGCPGAGRRSR
jgi:hypothetical protein